jgi:hypothetical protein
MPLTPAECRVAAERAKKYPKGFGSYFLPKELTATEQAELFPDDKPYTQPFKFSRVTSRWFKLHPEDVEKGCPAVAVAAMRGELDANGLVAAFCDVTAACNYSDSGFCIQLNYDPQIIAEQLELAAKDEWRIKTFGEEAINGDSTTDTNGMSSSDRSSEEVPSE